MRSQIGEVARLPITEDSRSMSVPGPAQRLAGFPATPPPQRPLSSYLSPTEYGSAMADDGEVTNGRALASHAAISELWCPDGWEWVAASTRMRFPGVFVAVLDSRNCYRQIRSWCSEDEQTVCGFIPHSVAVNQCREKARALCDELNGI